MFEIVCMGGVLFSMYILHYLLEDEIKNNNVKR
jgi:hypothetical protein